MARQLPVEASVGISVVGVSEIAIVIIHRNIMYKFVKYSDHCGREIMIQYDDIS
jgi:hypothetical protein